MLTVRTFIPQREFAALVQVLIDVEAQANTAAAKAGVLTPFREALATLEKARQSHYRRTDRRATWRLIDIPALPVSSIASGRRE